MLVTLEMPSIGRYIPAFHSSHCLHTRFFLRPTAPYMVNLKGWKTYYKLRKKMDVELPVEFHGVLLRWLCQRVEDDKSTTHKQHPFLILHLYFSGALQIIQAKLVSELPHKWVSIKLVRPHDSLLEMSARSPQLKMNTQLLWWFDIFKRVWFFLQVIES